MTTPSAQPPSKQERLSQLLDRYQNDELSRQAFLEQALQLLEKTPPATALQPVTLDHLTIKVPNLERSSRFYQQVLGMPLLRVEPDTHYLGLGSSFLGIQPSGSGQAYIDHYCLGLANYNTQDLLTRLAQKGVACDGEVGEDTLRFIDPDGLTVQLSSTDYARKQTVRTG
jgi:catechol 2,3-dioxygenase-like lactoylglutathione lyase family enzyme